GAGGLILVRPHDEPVAAGVGDGVVEHDLGGTGVEGVGAHVPAAPGGREAEPGRRSQIAAHGEDLHADRVTRGQVDRVGGRDVVRGSAEDGVVQWERGRVDDDVGVGRYVCDVAGD